MKPKWTLQPTDEQKVNALQAALKINPTLCRLLVQRGIETYDEAKLFFRPKLSDLHDPFLMLGMQSAIKRIRKAIVNKEKVLIYGDYDVDGTTSVALLHLFFGKYTSKLDYYIPDRYKEGYGVSAAGIDYAKQNGISLIIAVDCGVRAIEQVKRAKEMGIDFIICDHHLPDKVLPDAIALLNPKQEDCNYPYKELSGCGIAFKLIQAWALEEDCPVHETTDLLDLVVISIACDIVDMRGENRVLAFYGMQRLNNAPRLGLTALIDVSKRKFPLKITDVVFGLGPMINAVGRLEDARTAVKLLLSEEKQVAYNLARTLNDYNQQRKEFDKKIVEEAKDLFQSLPDYENRKSVVLCQEHWHKGVLGIAASRIMEAFFRPVIMLTESNGYLVGSARSVRGFNIYNAIEACAHLLVNFGGHSFAAGLILKKENLEAFQNKIEAYTQEHFGKTGEAEMLNVNAEVNTFEELTGSFWKILKQFAPFGPGNRNPLFAIRSVHDYGYSKVLGGSHLRLALCKEGSEKPFYGIGFGMEEDYAIVQSQEPFDLLFKLEENNWDGRITLRFLARGINYEEVMNHQKI